MSEVHNAFQYVFELRNRLEDNCRLARESIHAAQSSQKHLYDKKTRDRKFKVGNRVFIATTNGAQQVVAPMVSTT